MSKLTYNKTNQLTIEISADESLLSVCLMRRKKTERSI